MAKNHFQRFVEKKRVVILYVTFAAKNLKARCDVARQPLWRYVKGRHRSCDDTWSSATNLKKYFYLLTLVAELHVSSQRRWRPLTYRHRGCRATSSTVAHWYISGEPAATDISSPEIWSAFCRWSAFSFVSLCAFFHNMQLCFFYRNTSKKNCQKTLGLRAVNNYIYIHFMLTA